MPFTVAVVYFSRHGRLVTLANVVAEGARSVRIEIFSPFVFCCPTLLDQPLPLASLLSKKTGPGRRRRGLPRPRPLQRESGGDSRVSEGTRSRRRDGSSRNSDGSRRATEGVCLLAPAPAPASPLVLLRRRRPRRPRRDPCHACRSRRDLAGRPGAAGRDVRRDAAVSGQPRSRGRGWSGRERRNTEEQRRREQQRRPATANSLSRSPNNCDGDLPAREGRRGLHGYRRPRPRPRRRRVRFNKFSRHFSVSRHGGRRRSAFAGDGREPLEHAAGGGGGERR